MVYRKAERAQDLNFRLIWDGYGLENFHSGVSKYACSLFAQLREMGISPSILSSEIDSSRFPASQLLACSFPLGRTKLAWNLQTGFTLRNWLKEIPYNEKVVFHGLSNLNLPLVKLPKNVVTVLTVHDIIPLIARETVSFSYFLQFSLLLPRILDIADRVVCVSNWTRETLVEKFPKVTEKTTVISNGFEKNQFVDYGKASSSDFYSLLCVSRWEKYKRLWILPEVLKILPNVKLTIVTDKRGREFFKKNHAGFLSTGKLQVIGDLDSASLNSLYSQADVLVHPSLWEGHCLPASEALGHGIPVVYCAGSGIGETVQYCGISLDREASYEMWAEGVISACKLRYTSKFFEKVKTLVSSKPTWRESAFQLKELYNSL